MAPMLLLAVMVDDENLPQPNSAHGQAIVAMVAIIMVTITMFITTVVTIAMVMVIPAMMVITMGTIAVFFVHDLHNSSNEPLMEEENEENGDRFEALPWVP